MDEKKDFSNRCLLLQRKIIEDLAEVNSDRIIAAVLCQILGTLIHNQPDTDLAFKQIVEAIQECLDDWKENKKNMENV